VRTIFEILLPAKIDNTIRGSKIPFYVFTLYTIASIVRSCIHLLSPDDGAGTIAGMDLSVAGADGIIFAFALLVGAAFVALYLSVLVWYGEGFHLARREEWRAPTRAPQGHALRGLCSAPAGFDIKNDSRYDSEHSSER
jgi:hypothetical protein